jgi:hypothetical protein
MGIPVGNVHHAVTAGAVFKLVTCERCTHEFAFLMERTGEGAKTSLLFLNEDGASWAAKREAEAELQHRLERGVDVVPCPRCGYVQPRMVRKARREYHRWMLYVGGALLILLAPTAMFLVIGNKAAEVKGDPPLISWWWLLGGIALPALTGIGLMVGRLWLARRYDPNAGDPELAVLRGRQLALSQEEFARLKDAMSSPPSTEPQPELPPFPPSG